MKKLRGTDPREVIRALDLLLERSSIADVARELGVPYSSVDRWRGMAADYGPGWPTQAMIDQFDATRQVRAHRARQAAEYRKERITGTYQPRIVDSTGAVRRIHALQRLGWSCELISVHGPWTSRDAVFQFTRFPMITRRNAEIIGEIYDMLSMRIGPSDTARRWAEAQKWPPPLAWNDESIDDPTALPHGVGLVRRNPAGELDLQAVDRILGGDWKTPANKATRVEVVRRWDEAGRVRNELARLTGWKIERYSRPIRESVAS